MKLALTIFKVVGSIAKYSKVISVVGKHLQNMIDELQEMGVFESKSDSAKSVTSDKID